MRTLAFIAAAIAAAILVLTIAAAMQPAVPTDCLGIVENYGQMFCIKADGAHLINQ